MLDFVFFDDARRAGELEHMVLAQGPRTCENGRELCQKLVQESPLAGMAPAEATSMIKGLWRLLEEAPGSDQDGGDCLEGSLPRSFDSKP